jgi:hypothetical protein
MATSTNLRISGIVLFHIPSRGPTQKRIVRNDCEILIVRTDIAVFAEDADIRGCAVLAVKRVQHIERLRLCWLALHLYQAVSGVSGRSAIEEIECTQAVALSGLQRRLVSAPGQVCQKQNMHFDS